MQALEIVTPYFPDESPQSFVSRLAKLNFCRSAYDFCLDIGLRFQDIVDGQEQALMKLSSVTRASFSCIQQNSIRRTPDAFLLRDERLSRRALRRETLAICPSCVEADLASGSIGAFYGRTNWLLAYITTCQAHDELLVTVAAPPASRRFIHDFVLRVGDLSHVNLSFSRPGSFRSSLERYLLDRTAGRPRERILLDKFEMLACSKSCHNIGMAVAGKSLRKGEILNYKDSFTYGELGYHFLTHDEGRLMNSLQDRLPYNPLLTLQDKTGLLRVAIGSALARSIVGAIGSTS